MSAFVVHPSHVGLLAAAAAIKVYDLKGEYFAQRLAEHMMQENINSVLYKYQDIKKDVEFYKKNGKRFVELAMRYARHYLKNFPDWIKDCDIYNMSACINYQSCEHPEWEQSTAYSVVTRLKEQFVHAEYCENPTVSWEYVDQENLFGESQ